VIELPLAYDHQDASLAERVQAEFVHELAVHPVMIRRRLGRSDLAGAAAAADALARAANGVGAARLAQAASALQAALRPTASGGAPRICQALKILDRKVADTLLALLAKLPPTELTAA
jgi:HPt (histidine-containing phosphotransfer) domain-containing protein